MNYMSSDDNLSNEVVNHSILLTLAQSDSDSLWWLISDLTLQLRDADCYHGRDTGSHVANPDALCIKSI